jgi:hypothetical protein
MINELDNNEIVHNNEIDDEIINDEIVSSLEKPKKIVKIKKPRTEKQLAADKRLSLMAKQRSEKRKLEKLKKEHEKNNNDLEINLHKIADVIEEKLIIKEDVDESNLLAKASILDIDDNKIDVIVDEKIDDVGDIPAMELVDIKPKKVIKKKKVVVNNKKKKVPKKQKVVYYSTDEEETDSDTEIVYKKKEKSLKSVVAEYKNDPGLMNSFPKPLYIQSNNRFMRK